jgi:probable rRNA maturation factor
MNVELLGTEDLDISGIEAVLKILAERSPDWLPKGDIAVQFVDEATSQQLNLDYADNDYPTDVLTFNYAEDGEPVAGTLADVAICVPIAEAQAEAAKTSMKDELATLMLHAILHIAGFDHATDLDREEVDGLQADILDSAGLTYRNFNWKNA